MSHEQDAQGVQPAPRVEGQQSGGLPTGGNDEQYGKPPVDGDPLKAPPVQEGGEGQQEPEQLFAGKYKSVEELEKGYKELTQHLRGKGQIAPDEYDIEVQGEAVSLTEDDAAVFKELNLSNDTVQKLVAYMHESVVPQLTQAMMRAEVSDLGRRWGMDPESDAFRSRMGRIQGWAEKNFPAPVVAEMARSAEGIEALAKAMESGTPLQSSPAQHSLSKAQIDSLVQDDRYWTDPAYREQIEQRVRQAYS